MPKIKRPKRLIDTRPVKGPQYASNCKCVCGHEKDNHTFGGSCMGEAVRFAGHDYMHDECSCKSFRHSDTCECNLSKEAK